MRNELAEEVEDAMESPVARRLLDGKTLGIFARDHKSLVSDRSEALWILLVLRKWWEKWGGSMP